MSNDTPEIAVKISASGADEIAAEFERLRQKAEESLSKIDAQARETAQTAQVSTRQTQVVAQSAVEQSSQQVGLLDRLAGALGSTAGWVAERVKEIAIAASVAGAALSAAYGASYVALDIWSTKSAQEGQDLLNIAKASGVSVEALTRWGFAADIAAGSSDQVSAAFQKVSNALIAYQDKGDEASLGLFKQVGLDAEVASGKVKTAEDVFGRLGDKLKAIPDGARRAKAAYDLLGGGAKELLPVFEKSAADLKSLQEEAKKYGETKASDLAGNTKLLEDKRRLTLALGDIKDTFADAFFNMFAKGTDKTAAWLRASKDQIESYVEGLVDTFGGIADDIGKLFGTPLSEKVKIKVDGKDIDLDKNRMIGLVKLGQEAGRAVSDAAEDGAESAGEAADEVARVSMAELDNYIKIGGVKVQYDEERNKKYIEQDGKRVEVSKQNSAKILSDLSSSVARALENATPEAAKNLRFQNSWLGAFYAPAQELRRLALDTMDALAGKGWGGRSESIKLIGVAYDWVKASIISLRDSVLAFFGTSYEKLPSIQRMIDLAKAAWEDFRDGMSGRAAVAFPWAGAFGNAVRSVIGFLKPMAETALAVGGLMLRLALMVLPIVADAFVAFFDAINKGHIDDSNMYAWMNKFIPDMQRAFYVLSQIFLGLLDVAKNVFLALATDENLDRLKRAVITVAEWIWWAIQRIYGTWSWLAAILIPVLDVIAKAFGLKDWKDLGLVLLVYWLVGKVADIIGLGNAFARVDSIIKGALWWTLAMVALALVTITALIMGLFGLPALAAAGIVAALVIIGGTVIRYWEDIKAGSNTLWEGVKSGADKAADAITSRWNKLKEWFVEKLYPVVGKWLGWEKPQTPEDKAAKQAEENAKREEAEKAKRGPVKPDAPDKAQTGQIVKGTDGVFRFQDEEERRTGTGSEVRDAALAKSKAELDAVVAKRQRIFEKAVRDTLIPEGNIGAERTVEGRAPETFAGFRSALNALREKPEPEESAKIGSVDDVLKMLRERIAGMGEGLTAQTPFAKAPLATPDPAAGGPPAGMVAFQPSFAPAKDTLYGSPEAVQNILQKLEEAGLAVKTPRPREL